MAESSLSPPTIPPTFAPFAPAVEVDLRPLTTSELIDRGFTLYRAHFAGFLLLALLCQSAPLLGQILVTSLNLNLTQEELTANPSGFFDKVCLVSLVTFIAQLIVFAFELIITYYIADAYL